MNPLSTHLGAGKLLRLVTPTVLMMVFISIYYMADGFFVSNFVGKTPFAGLNIIFPALMMFSPLGFMFSTGGSAYVSKLLGEKKEDEGRAAFTTIVLACLGLSVVLAILGYFLTPAISSLLGAEGDLLSYSVLYGHILFPAIPFFVMQNMLQGFLLTSRKGALGFSFMFIAGMMNILLDALFVVFFQWGLPGAAYATVLSQMTGALLPILYFSRTPDKVLYFTKPLVSLHPVSRSMANGLSGLMTYVSAPLVTMLYNYELLTWLGEDGLAAYSVISYISFLFDAVYMGYSDALIPVTAYQYGARNRQELSHLLHSSLKILSVAGLILSFTAFSTAPYLASFFVGYDRSLTELTTHAFRLYCLCYLLSGFSKYGDAFFTALNNGTVSAVISFSHTLIFEVAAILLLPALLGPDGLWFSLTAAEIGSVAVVAAFLKGLKREYGY